MISSCIFLKRRRIHNQPSIHSLIRMRLHLSPPSARTHAPSSPARTFRAMSHGAVVSLAALLFYMRGIKIHRPSTSRYSAQTFLPLLTSNGLQADVPCRADTNMRSVMMSLQRPRENGLDCFTVLCLAPFPERMEWRRRRSIFGIFGLGLRLLRRRSPRRHRSRE